MVVVTILPRAEFGLNDHREDAPHYTRRRPLVFANQSIQHKKIFRNVNLRDERIVGFKAHDIEQNQDRIDRIIIMDYMEYGSLQNYLNHREISKRDALKLISTLIQGWFSVFKKIFMFFLGVKFLHLEVRGSDQIASVAHRDISSKSVMVNSDGQCCISDFGMAIR